MNDDPALDSNPAYLHILQADGFFEKEVRSISLVPAAPPNNQCDVWGNVQGEPAGSTEERHGDWYVKITVYCVEGKFYYGYQIKIGTMIRQKTANIKDRAFSTAELARSSASVEIERVCNTNKNVKKLFADFIRIRYNQGSLFEGVSDE